MNPVKVTPSRSRIPIPIRRSFSAAPVVNIQLLQAKYDEMEDFLKGTILKVSALVEIVRQNQEEVKRTFKDLYDLVTHLQKRLTSVETNDPAKSTLAFPSVAKIDAKIIQSEIDVAKDKSEASRHCIIIAGIPEISAERDQKSVVEVLTSIGVTSIPQAIRRLGRHRSVLQVEFHSSIESFTIRQAFLRYKARVPQFGSGEVTVKIDRPFALRRAMAKLLSTLSMLKDKHAHFNAFLAPGFKLCLAGKYYYSLDHFFFPTLCLPDNGGLLVLPGPGDTTLDLRPGHNPHCPSPELA